MKPRTKYAKSGDVHIAYQVLGTAPSISSSFRASFRTWSGGGLSLAELCLRELGWTPLWLGRRTPVGEVVRLVSGAQVAMVALSASALLGDELALRAITDEVGAACKERGVALLLGGAGAWPSQPSYGVRATSFAAFHHYLAEQGDRR